MGQLQVICFVLTVGGGGAELSVGRTNLAFA